MKLWLLKPYEDWEPWFDKAFGFVIRAETEEAARAIASENAGDEGGTPWLLSSHTSCVELLPEGESGLVLRDFAAA